MIIFLLNWFYLPLTDLTAPLRLLPTILFFMFFTIMVPFLSSFVSFFFCCYLFLRVYRPLLRLVVYLSYFKLLFELLVFITFFFPLFEVVYILLFLMELVIELLAEPNAYPDKLTLLFEEVEVDFFIVFLSLELEKSRKFLPLRIIII